MHIQYICLQIEGEQGIYTTGLRKQTAALSVLPNGQDFGRITQKGPKFTAAEFHCKRPDSLCEAGQKVLLGVGNTACRYNSAVYTYVVREIRVGEGPETGAQMPRNPFQGQFSYKANAWLGFFILYFFSAPPVLDVI